MTGTLPSLAAVLSPLVALGPLGSPPALLVGLVLLAIVILVGRMMLAVAWRLVIVAVVAVIILWVLAAFGISVL